MKKQKYKKNFISLRGVTQHNLKNLDVNIPLNQLTILTGPSGSGKSSLAFHTLYAEGQRRYIETFSPYTRQFFERMDKPQAKSIDGIPPAIAIRQTNQIRSTRSTVGTLTEINEYLKLLFPRIATAHDPKTNEIIQPDTPKSIFKKAQGIFSKEEPLLITFPISVPKKSRPEDFFPLLEQQGYLRLYAYEAIYRTDQPETFPHKYLPASLHIIQDRIPLTKKTRILEAFETSLRLGKGHLTLIDPRTPQHQHYTTTWTNPNTGFSLQPPSPALFTFNHPLGTCPTCRGFGKTIALDLDLALPDKTLPIQKGLVRAFQGNTYAESQNDLLKAARKRDISITTPYCELPEIDQQWILYGEPNTSAEEAYENGLWYGVQGFFQWLESRAYKMHVRVFLSRYRNETTCQNCQGTRLTPDALHYKITNKNLPQLWSLPIIELLEFFEKNFTLPKKDPTTKLLHTEITNRLRYLIQVGLSYLNLNRESKTLSGGEIARVNLTTAIGSSLTQTLFILDEPSIGLHPSDIQRLIETLHQLRNNGNTLVVVEHDPAIILSADHLIDLGPTGGENGGYICSTDILPVATSNKNKKANQEEQHYPSPTLKALQNPITPPKKRRHPDKNKKLTLRGATCHNIQNLDLHIPLKLFVCLAGVSGSGKSTLAHHILTPHLLQSKNQKTPLPTGQLRKLKGAEHLNEIILIDQNQLGRTPRSTPAVITGIFDSIRTLFSQTPEAKKRKLNPGYFSFNSGEGRCQRCQGAGHEKIEMQFLSDLYLKCPECNGSRYQPEALKIKFQNHSITDILNLTVDQARDFFNTEKISARIKQKVLPALILLSETGLDYLRLGQPLNTLSGGESQRLKLATHLLKSSPSKNNHTLFILDEPTTGLHLLDVAKLLTLLHKLVDAGNSLIVIEHHADILNHADWLIELGPGGGPNGGKVIAQGTPEEVAKQDTPTAQYLLQKESGGRMPMTKSNNNAQTLQEKFHHPRHKTKSSEQSTNTSRLLVDQRQDAPATISLHGAREHNLKNINIDIPLNENVVISGLSGSGKSTLAFDILFAEGQRRFLDALSPYARQFADQLPRPDIDHISGLPPTVAIEQRITRGGSKSTVATITEIYQFLRLLYAKIGTQHCPESGLPVVSQTPQAISEKIKTVLQKNTHLQILAPLIRARKGYHTDIAKWAIKHGYPQLLVDGFIKESANFGRLTRYQTHNIDVLILEITKKTPTEKIKNAINEALDIGKGTLTLRDDKGKIEPLSTKMVSPATGRSFAPLEPNTFSFNSPRGWCPDCRGHGFKIAHKLKTDTTENLLQAEIEEQNKIERAQRKKSSEELTPCPTCSGTRLREEARHVKVHNTPIQEITKLSVQEAKKIIQTWQDRPAPNRKQKKQAKSQTIPILSTKREAEITRDILPEIIQRLDFLSQVGLSYLQLNRSAPTLSGGESQRIRLASQLGSTLRGVLYILDEPTIGLHPRDNQQLIQTLNELRDKGNSLVIVEHDEDCIRNADHLIDLGPGAGRLGGEICSTGILPGSESRKNKKIPKEKSRPPRHKTRHKTKASQQDSNKSNLLVDHDRDGHATSPTLHALANPIQHPIRGKRRKLAPKKEKDAWFTIKNAKTNNLKNLTVHIPIGRLTVLSGPSGSGKSTLLKKEIKPFVSNKQEICSAIYEVDQSPIGKTPRSTPATYIKLFDHIRALFAQTPDARIRGFTASRFSFNTAEGACPTCKGQGRIRLEMSFLPTSYHACEDCQENRYNPSTLEIQYQEKTIAEVLRMTIEEAAEFFSTVPHIHRPLQLLKEIGLGYLQLGQASPTLSGGEAQRIKLAAQLVKNQPKPEKLSYQKKSALYLIEEPTIGLHSQDVLRLIDLLHRLVDAGNTVIVIEHNLDLIAEADYLIDLGPNAGEDGGKVCAQGTPEHVAKTKSPTAEFLKKILKKVSI